MFSSSWCWRRLWWWWWWCKMIWYRAWNWAIRYSDKPMDSASTVSFSHWGLTQHIGLEEQETQCGVTLQHEDGRAPKEGHGIWAIELQRNLGGLFTVRWSKARKHMPNRFLNWRVILDPFGKQQFLFTRGTLPKSMLSDMFVPGLVLGKMKTCSGLSRESPVCSSHCVRPSSPKRMSCCSNPFKNIAWVTGSLSSAPSVSMCA